MAKKKTKTTKRATKSRRRGRVSGGVGMISGIPVETIAAVTAGAIASQALNGIAQNVKALQNNPKILPLLKIGIGAVILTKSKSDMLQGVGAGFIADGGLQAVRALAPNVFRGFAGNVSGLGIGSSFIDLDDFGSNRVSGADDYIYAEDSSVGGYSDQDYALGAV